MTKQNEQTKIKQKREKKIETTDKNHIDNPIVIWYRHCSTVYLITFGCGNTVISTTEKKNKINKRQ